MAMIEECLAPISRTTEKDRAPWRAPQRRNWREDLVRNAWEYWCTLAWWSDHCCARSESTVDDTVGSSSCPHARREKRWTSIDAGHRWRHTGLNRSVKKASIRPKKIHRCFVGGEWFQCFCSGPTERWMAVIILGKERDRQTWFDRRWAVRGMLDSCPPPSVSSLKDCRSAKRSSNNLTSWMAKVDDISRKPAASTRLVSYLEREESGEREGRGEKRRDLARAPK